MFQSISWASLTVVALGIVIHVCAGLGAGQVKRKAKRHPLGWCGWENDLDKLGKLKRLDATGSLGEFSDTKDSAHERME